MSSSSIKRKRTAVRTDNRLSADDSGARLVIDDEGRIVFVSESFAGLVNRPAEGVRGQPLGNFLEFADPDEAIGLRAGQPLVNEGIHRAHLSGHAGDAFVLMQFDRITTREG